MVMLRNGKASIGQLAVKDFNSGEDAAKTAFVIPDTGLDQPGGVANATNTFTTDLFTSGRYNAMTVGGDSTAESDQHTGLGDEFLSADGNGLERRSDAEIVTYLTDATSSEDAWKANWQTTWQVAGTAAIWEFGVASKAAEEEGLHLMRQVEDEALDVISGDLVNAILTMKLTGTLSSSGTTGTAQAAVTYEGLRELCRLTMDPATTRRGEDGTSGDWQTDYTIGGVANRVERQFDQRAIGDQGSDEVGGEFRTLAHSDTALGDEHTTADLARRKDGDTDGDARGTIMQDHNTGTAAPWNGIDDNTDNTVGNEGTAFGSDTETVFVGDTVQWAAKWILTTNRRINESGTFNGDNPSGTGPAPDDPGVMLMEFTEAADIQMDENGRFISIHRLQVV